WCTSNAHDHHRVHRHHRLPAALRALAMCPREQEASRITETSSQHQQRPRPVEATCQPRPPEPDGTLVRHSTRRSTAGETVRELEVWASAAVTGGEQVEGKAAGALAAAGAAPDGEPHNRAAVAPAGAVVGEGEPGTGARHLLLVDEVRLAGVESLAEQRG